jgi:large subunit ribosomal protein L15
MLTLDTLQNTTRPFKKRKLLGRGVGCKKGKTCGRGHKGAGARSGYKRRWGTVGGGVPLHKRLPTRGFSHAGFKRSFDVINLEEINEIFQDGETVSLETLREKGYLKGHSNGVKILSNGELTKKVKIQVEAISSGAKDKLKKAGISV